MEGRNCLELLTDGQRAGLECLYKLFASDLLKYGIAICGNYEEAEECIHDFFVFIWEQREKLGNITNARAYLFISFKRRLIKQLEKQKKTVSFDINLEMEENDSSIEEDLINEESEKEYLSKLAQGLKSLSDREREVIHLKYFEKHSNEEISKILEINYQSVRNLLYRAIQNLRKFL